MGNDRLQTDELALGLPPEETVDLAEFRALFPIAELRAYLFTGAIAPAAAPVRAAFDSWADSWAHDPLTNYRNFGREVEHLRSAFARLIGASPGEVAITDSTSRGANMVIGLLASMPGRNVVVDDSTYPSSRYPWMTLTDKEIRYAATDSSPDPLAAIAAVSDSHVAALAISHVAPLTGKRHDLASLGELVHSRGGVLMVDAAQSTGVIPIDVTRDRIDILVSTSMKWLLGPPGIGFLYIKRELLDQMPVADIGYLGVVVEGEDWPMTTLPEVIPDSHRLELGLPTLSGLAAAASGLDLIMSVGVEVIAGQVERLVSICLHMLGERGHKVRTPRDPTRRAGVIAFEHSSAEELAAFCRRHAVDIGGYPWGLVRVDPHAFNTVEDVERFVEALDTYSRRA